jgi:exonuclease III
MKIILWNVNGLRSVIKKDSLSFLNSYDTIILNETPLFGFIGWLFEHFV